MRELLIVGVGGFVGSILRFKVGSTIFHALPGTRFPWGTLTVNICGCMLVGIIASLLERLSSHNADLRLLLITGFLGGFTTFSAFGLETMQLLRIGEFSLAAANILASVLLGLTAVWLGLWLGHHVG
ncbi:MAG: fluoride efflux transporter CrcB [Deltaproteobacteria bacterium]|nr:fluoride efflux transporter CrcB [Deltaproteobacteria bacterium]